jgi:hypothetical protein
VNDVRHIINRARVDIRPRRKSVSHVQVEQARDRAWLAASLPRVSL